MNSTESRRRPSLLATLAAFVLAGAPLGAQGQTWVVDEAGGPGSHFTNLPPALQAAQDGDTVLVRTGTYDGGTVTRGISILADGGARVSVRIPAGLFGSALDVRGIAAGKTVVLQGLRALLPTGFSVGSSFVTSSNCAGRVHCDRLHADLLNGSLQGFLGMSIGNCAHVSIQGCTLSGGFPLRASSSTVLITDSSLAGQSAGGLFGRSVSSSIAMIVTDCQLTLSRTTVSGGGGDWYLGMLLEPSAAIQQTNGRTTVSGASGASILAGSGAVGLVSAPTPAIDGSGGLVLVDPRVTIASSGGAPTIALGHTTTIERVPSISAIGAPPGGTLAIDLLATAGDLSEIYLGLPFGPVPSPLPGTGEIWVDFGALINLGRQVVPVSERVTRSVSLPAVAGIRGLPVTIQALTASTAAGLRFSTPATPVLN